MNLCFLNLCQSVSPDHLTILTPGLRPLTTDKKHSLIRVNPCFLTA